MFEKLSKKIIKWAKDRDLILWGFMMNAKVLFNPL